ncbi:peptide-N4-asparagine amidase [Streptomyces sp. NPDC002779]|uniref:peptide-N4-asparagine amidase n=1 Tax=Streptomyces sp. NPDC002779 TaxID=3364664 RepID=UPI00367AFFB7
MGPAAGPHVREGRGDTGQSAVHPGLDGKVKGRQYDRLGHVSVGGVEIFRTSIPQPSPDGIAWSVEKDVTQHDLVPAVAAVGGRGVRAAVRRESERRRAGYGRRAGGSASRGSRGCRNLWVRWGPRGQPDRFGSAEKPVAPDHAATRTCHGLLPQRAVPASPPPTRATGTSCRFKTFRIPTQASRTPARDPASCGGSSGTSWADS